MKELILINDVVMSTVDIAILTGKRHDNVLRDTEKMLKELEIDGLKFEEISKDSLNRDRKTYNLPKRECLALVSGYSLKLRVAIIDRWQELEANARPMTYIESLEALLKSEKAKELAIATKAEIGSRREATAMNTASTQTKRANKLEVELDQSKEFSSVKRMEMLHGIKYSWRKLKSACQDLEIQPEEVFDANYGTVKAWPADAWMEAYAIDITSKVQ